jgi:hypothetical protein
MTSESALKAQQVCMGSRRAYAHLEEGAGWQTRVTPELAEFIATLNGFYLATSNGAVPARLHQIVRFDELSANSQ